MAGPLTRESTYVGNLGVCCLLRMVHQPSRVPLADLRARQVLFTLRNCAVRSRSRVRLTPEKIAQLQWKKTAIEALNASTVNGDVEGLVHGKEVQNCPKRHKVVHLDGGCNHISCPCTASFCFKCGLLAGEHSGHWNREGCPMVW
jgi:hypothetical protein